MIPPLFVRFKAKKMYQTGTNATWWNLDMKSNESTYIILVVTFNLSMCNRQFLLILEVNRFLFSKFLRSTYYLTPILHLCFYGLGTDTCRAIWVHLCRKKKKKSDIEWRLCYINALFSQILEISLGSWYESSNNHCEF